MSLSAFVENYNRVPFVGFIVRDLCFYTNTKRNGEKDADSITGGSDKEVIDYSTND